ncbi:MAG TPA: tetratricopeptide repeat protein [Ferruginibacter sp.]|jgi:tetratricopeptide (TPR) repeat protein|nr:tetratricopeptide repeat protein [Ferruginibacter sp.]HPH90154.1 tetratricopeptide repeat protein [Ferruginibacter sp.]
MKIIVTLLLFLCSFQLKAQAIDEKQLLLLVADKDKAHFQQADSILLTVYHKSGDTEKKQLLRFFSANAGSSDPYIAARCLLWQGVIVLRPPFNNTKEPFGLMQQAIRRAIESGDEYLMVQCFEIFALNCTSMGRPETALFYLLKTAEIRKRIGDDFFFVKNQDHFGTIGDLLYKMQEYEQAIQYISIAMIDTVNTINRHMISMNTLGLAYQRLGKRDSALYWYNKALEAAIVNKHPVWQGIISGNTGSLYFDMQEDDKALPLLWRDYNSSIPTEINNAGNTLHRIALILLRKGKSDSALQLARQSYNIVSAVKPPNPFFIRNASYALSEVFKKRRLADSAFFYADAYHHLNDSINRSAATNRMDVVQTKLDYEKLSSSVNILLREKESEKSRRNYLVAAILLLVAAGWFYFRWQRQQFLNKQQLLMHQQQIAGTEIINAREKLEEFTKHLVEKNLLIENLQEQLQQQNLEVNETLQNQTILTENDWLRFKEMFEKAHPGFISKLQQAAPDITTAELRLAALIRLNLGNKHIASMLGIGTDAVRKTKSRLRQRLNITIEDGLEDFIRAVPAQSAN